MKPELKLGRPVVTDTGEKGFYVKDSHVLIDGEIRKRNHLTIDLSTPPMTGDEVEGSNYKDRCFYRFRYIGQRSDGLHCVEANGIQVIRDHVRFPQSKRDRIKEAIRSWQESSKVPMYDDLADQIDKIYKEDS